MIREDDDKEIKLIITQLMAKEKGLELTKTREKYYNSRYTVFIHL